MKQAGPCVFTTLRLHNPSQAPSPWLFSECHLQSLHLLTVIRPQNYHIVPLSPTTRGCVANSAGTYQKDGDREPYLIYVLGTTCRPARRSSYLTEISPSASPWT